MIFSCTSKVIKRFTATTLISDVRHKDQMDNWYADQLVLERKKFFLFTNSKTLFSFLVNFGTKKQILNFNSIFEKAYKEQIIKCYGLENNDFELFDQNLKVITYSKTNNRSILGSMSDFKLNISARIYQDGLNEASLNSINYYLNQIPMGALKFKSPYESHKEQIQI